MVGCPQGGCEPPHVTRGEPPPRGGRAPRFRGADAPVPLQGFPLLVPPDSTPRTPECTEQEGTGRFPRPEGVEWGSGDPHPTVRLSGSPCDHPSVPPRHCLSLSGTVCLFPPPQRLYLFELLRAPRTPNKALQFLRTADLFLVSGEGGCKVGAPHPQKKKTQTQGSRGGVPLGLEGLLAPELDVALGGGEQAGQGGVEGEGLHHAAAHRQAERLRALQGRNCV